VCFDFLYNFSATFLIRRRIERDINIHASSCQERVIPDRQIFEKYLTVKFHENPSSAAKLYPAGGQTDGQTGKET
jgi:hypothetical protein